MAQMSKFQLILLGIFTVFILVAVFAFSFSRGTSSGKLVIDLAIWGTMDQGAFLSLAREFDFGEDVQLVLNYTQVNMATFDQDFIEALAAGRGPDLFFLPHDRILRHADKLLPIPYETFTERQFRDTFIEGSEIFLTSKGAIAVPFLVDPLMMYWNRTLFTNANLSTPPTAWDQFFTIVPALTRRDGALNVTQSGVALGEFQNVTNAKHIISMLAMQAGNPITHRDRVTDRITPVFSDRFSFPVAPSEAAVNFYTEFSNPIKSFYSWNRSLPPSQDAFVAGDLAIYFGFASELPLLRAKNPNLNFDVARVPQARDTVSRLTYGRMVGLAIPKSSRKAASAFNFAMMITSPVNAAKTAQAIGLPPLRRDLLAQQPPTDAFGAAFYESSLYSRAWYEPERNEVNRVFQTMIESITGGRVRTSDAVSRANAELLQLLDRYNFVRR